MHAMKRQVGRNDPCPCGSGRKYKKCCQEHEGKAGPWQRLLIFAMAVGLAGGLYLAITSIANPPPPQQGVWSPEHGHYH